MKGVTMSEITPHQPRTTVVPVLLQNSLRMHDLQSLPRIDFERRKRRRPMF